MESEQIQPKQTNTNLATDIYTKLSSYVNYYSTKTIDSVGTMLGINVNGKPLSKQSVPELIQGFTSFSTKLKDPRIQAAIVLSIKEMKPIVREAALSYTSIAVEMGKLAYREAVDTACFLPPFSFVCSGTMMLDAANKFGEKVLKESVVIQDVMEKASDKYNELSDKLKSMPEYSESIKSFNNISDKANNFISDKLSDTINSIPSAPSTNHTIKQSGGLIQSGGLKKTRKHRRHISRRVNKSLKEFLGNRK